MFIWTPSHYGVTRNEQADRAANMARKPEATFVDTINEVLVEAVKKHLFLLQNQNVLTNLSCQMLLLTLEGRGNKK